MDVSRCAASVNIPFQGCLQQTTQTTKLLICLRRQWHPALFFDPTMGYTMSMKIPGYIASYRTGSNYTVIPPVTDTDIDYLVLVKDLKEACDAMLADGFVLCDQVYAVTEEGHTTRWCALRKGELNLIVQADLTLYVRSCAATELCRALNVKSKEDRIALFRAVKFGASADSLDLCFTDKAFVREDLVPNVGFAD